MRKKQEVKERIDWIDTLRGLGMLFVVWGHSIPYKYPVRKYIYSFHMPLFFFISGLTFGDSDKLDYAEYIKKKFKSLIVPYIIINIICYVLSVILFKVGVLEEFNYLDNIMGIFYSNGEKLPFPSSPTWFLITLFISELVFFFLKKNSTNDFNLGISVCVCGLIGYVNSLSEYQIFAPWHLNTVFMAVVFYYAGYLFMKNIKKFDYVFENKKRMFLMGCELGLIGLIFEYYNRRVSMHANVYGSITLFYISVFATIFGLILFVRLFLNKSYIFKRLGQNTIFYLGYHLLAIQILWYFMPAFKKGNLKVLALSIMVCAILLPISILAKKYFPILIGKLPSKAKN